MDLAVSCCGSVGNPSWMYRTGQCQGVVGTPVPRVEGALSYVTRIKLAVSHSAELLGVEPLCLAEREHLHPHEAGLEPGE